MPARDGSRSAVRRLLTPPLSLRGGGTPPKQSPVVAEGMPEGDRPSSRPAVGRLHPLSAGIATPRWARLAMTDGARSGLRWGGPRPPCHCEGAQPRSNPLQQRKGCLKGNDHPASLRWAGCPRPLVIARGRYAPEAISCGSGRDACERWKSICGGQVASALGGDGHAALGAARNDRWRSPSAGIATPRCAQLAMANGCRCVGV